MNKNFITGFICGGIICATITGFAVEYAVTANPYTVKVNGEITAIEGYNINNSTYFKLRDVSEAVGGFRVDFVNNEIMVTNINPAPASAIAPKSMPVKNILGLKDGEAVDGLSTEFLEGKYYVYQQEIQNKYKGDYAFHLNDDGSYKISWKEKVFFDNYPQGGEYNLAVELNWYNTVLQPWLADEGWKE